MKQLLLVEDDPLLGKGLHDFLSGKGYQCHWVQQVSEVSHYWSQADLVILDRQLPEGDSITLLPEWLSKKALPVIILTARTEVSDRIEGLQAGARDYVLKPFFHEELLARIQAHLRPISHALLHYQSITLNLSARQVDQGDQRIALKPKEFELLALLLQNPDKVYHRDELLNKVWGFQSFPSTRTIDNHVLNLRKKLPELRIETIRGIGYRLDSSEGIRHHA